MGVDLTLIIDDSGSTFSETMGYVCGYNRLSLSRDYETQNLIGRLELTLLNSKLGVYEDDGFQKVETDAYGGALTYVTASILSRVLVKSPNQWDRGIGMFLDTIKPETRVVLYWH